MTVRFGPIRVQRPAQGRQVRRPGATRIWTPCRRAPGTNVSGGLRPSPYPPGYRAVSGHLVHQDATEYQLVQPQVPVCRPRLHRLGPRRRLTIHYDQNHGLIALQRLRGGPPGTVVLEPSGVLSGSQEIVPSAAAISKMAGGGSETEPQEHTSGRVPLPEPRQPAETPRPEAPSAPAPVPFAPTDGS